MKLIKLFSQSLSILAVVGAIGMSSTAMAHDADCPYCKLKVVQNTKEMDNEVVVKVGNKNIEYRCLYCVLKDQNRYKSDLIVYAPSETKGEPVVMKRTGGKWTAPEGAMFLNSFKAHADCATLSRAFTNKAALDKYVASVGAKDAKAMTLAEFTSAVAK